MKTSEFVEKYLGIKLLDFQKEKDEGLIFSRAHPGAAFLWAIIANWGLSY